MEYLKGAIFFIILVVIIYIPTRLHLRSKRMGKAMSEWRESKQTSDDAIDKYLRHPTRKNKRIALRRRGIEEKKHYNGG